MGNRDRNLPANLKLRAPGPEYDQVEMREAFRQIEQHYHIQQIPLSSVDPTPATPTDTPPDDDGTFPTRGLMALYDADLGVTTITRPSSNADAYSAFQVDAPYQAVTHILDQSGNGYHQSCVGAFGPMRSLNNLSRLSIKSPGGGVGHPLVVTVSATLTAASIFCVARPGAFVLTQANEFEATNVFAMGSNTGDSHIGGYDFSTATQFQFNDFWSGHATADGLFDIVCYTWDGTEIRGYRNGLRMGFQGALPPQLAGPRSLTAISSSTLQSDWMTWGLWSVKLTGAEIRNMFNVMAPKYGIVAPL